LIPPTGIRTVSTAGLNAYAELVIPARKLATRSAWALALLLVLGGCRVPLTTPFSVAADGVAQFRVEVVATTPHDAQAYTQGLVVEGDQLFESTGSRRRPTPDSGGRQTVGPSSLRRVDRATGTILQQIELEPQLFGEGLTRVGDRLIQLTWLSHQAIVYDAETFDELERFSYDTEGWGLCFDGDQLIMSDGSAELSLRDPVTFEERRRVTVRLLNDPVARINELECVDGLVYANVFQTDQIIIIDPDSGQVAGVIDASGLLDRGADPGAGVLNGIAYDATSERFFITGKLWPTLFEVRWIQGPGAGATGSDARADE